MASAPQIDNRFAVVSGSRLNDPLRGAESFSQNDNNFVLDFKDSLRLTPNKPGISEPILRNKLLAILDHKEQELFSADQAALCRQFITQGPDTLNYTERKLVKGVLNRMIQPDLQIAFGLSMTEVQQLGKIGDTLYAGSFSEIAVAQNARKKMAESAGISQTELKYHQYSQLVDPDSAAIKEVYDTLTQNGTITDSMTELDMVKAILKHVQSTVTYQKDAIQGNEKTGDHWQSVEETLQMGTGDCEDMAILTASLTMYALKERGHSDTDIRNMVKVEAGFMDSNQTVGHVVASVSGLEGGIIPDLVLDATDTQSPILKSDFKMDKVFEFNDSQFNVFKEVDDTFTTALQVAGRDFGDINSLFQDKLETVLGEIKRSIQLPAVEPNSGKMKLKNGQALPEGQTNFGLFTVDTKYLAANSGSTAISMPIQTVTLNGDAVKDYVNTIRNGMNQVSTLFLTIMTYNDALISATRDIEDVGLSENERAQKARNRQEMDKSRSEFINTYTKLSETITGTAENIMGQINSFVDTANDAQFAKVNADIENFGRENAGSALATGLVNETTGTFDFVRSLAKARAAAEKARIKNINAQAYAQYTIDIGEDIQLWQDGIGEQTITDTSAFNPLGFGKKAYDIMTADLGTESPSKTKVQSWLTETKNQLNYLYDQVSTSLAPNPAGVYFLNNTLGEEAGIENEIDAALFTKTGGSIKPFADLNQDKIVQFQQFITQYQNVVRAAVMLRFELINRTRIATEDLSGNQGSTALDAMQTVANQNLNAELKKQLQGFEALKSNIVAFGDALNEVVKNRAAYWKSTIQIPIKTTKLSASIAASVANASTASSIAATQTTAALGVVAKLKASSLGTNPIADTIVGMIPAATKEAIDYYTTSLNAATTAGINVTAAVAELSLETTTFENISIQSIYEHGGSGSFEFSTQANRFNELNANAKESDITLQHIFDSDNIAATGNALEQFIFSARKEKSITQNFDIKFAGLNYQNLGELPEAIKNRGDGMVTSDGVRVARRESYVNQYYKEMQLFMTIFQHYINTVRSEISRLTGGRSSSIPNDLYSIIDTNISMEQSILSFYQSEMEAEKSALNADMEKNKAMIDAGLKVESASLDQALSPLAAAPPIPYLPAEGTIYTPGTYTGDKAHNAASIAKETEETIRRYTWGPFAPFHASYHSSDPQQRNDGIDNAYLNTVNKYQTSAFDTEESDLETVKQNLTAAGVLSEDLKDTTGDRYTRYIAPFADLDEEEKKILSDTFASGRQFTGTGLSSFQEVNYQAIIDAQKQLNTVFAIRSVISMVLEALTNAQIKASEKLSGSSNQFKIFEGVNKNLDTQATAQLAALSGFTEEWVNRADSFNTKREGEIGLTTESGMLTGMFLTTLALSFGNKTAANIAKYATRYSQFKESVSLLSNMIIGALIIGQTNQKTAHASSDLFDYRKADEAEEQRQKEDARKIEAIANNNTLTERQKNRRITAIKRTSRIRSAFNQNMQQNRDKDRSDNMGINTEQSIAFTGRFRVTGAELRAQTELNRRHRQLEAVQRIMLTYVDAVLAATESLGGSADGSRSFNAALSILSRFKSSESAQLSSVQKAMQQRADILNKGAERIEGRLGQALTKGTSLAFQAAKKLRQDKKTEANNKTPEKEKTGWDKTKENLKAIARWSVLLPFTLLLKLWEFLKKSTPLKDWGEKAKQFLFGEETEKNKRTNKVTQDSVWKGSAKEKRSHPNLVQRLLKTGYDQGWDKVRKFLEQSIENSITASVSGENMSEYFEKLFGDDEELETRVVAGEENQLEANEDGTIFPELALLENMMLDLVLLNRFMAISQEISKERSTAVSKIGLGQSFLMGLINKKVKENAETKAKEAPEKEREILIRNDPKEIEKLEKKRKKDMAFMKDLNAKGQKAVQSFGMGHDEKTKSTSKKENVKSTLNFLLIPLRGITAVGNTIGRFFAGLGFWGKANRAIDAVTDTANKGISFSMQPDSSKNTGPANNNNTGNISNQVTESQNPHTQANTDAGMGSMRTRLFGNQTSRDILRHHAGAGNFESDRVLGIEQALSRAGGDIDALTAQANITGNLRLYANDIDEDKTDEAAYLAEHGIHINTTGNAFRFDLLHMTDGNVKTKLHRFRNTNGFFQNGIINGQRLLVSIETLANDPANPLSDSEKAEFYHLALSMIRLRMLHQHQENTNNLLRRDTVTNADALAETNRFKADRKQFEALQNHILGQLFEINDENTKRLDALTNEWNHGSTIPETPSYREGQFVLVNKNGHLSLEAATPENMRAATEKKMAIQVTTADGKTHTVLVGTDILESPIDTRELTPEQIKNKIKERLATTLGVDDHRTLDIDDSHDAGLTLLQNIHTIKQQKTTRILDDAKRKAERFAGKRDRHYAYGQIHHGALLDQISNDIKLMQTIAGGDDNFESSIATGLDQDTEASVPLTIPDTAKQLSDQASDSHQTFMESLQDTRASHGFRATLEKAASLLANRVTHFSGRVRRAKTNTIAEKTREQNDIEAKRRNNLTKKRAHKLAAVLKTTVGANVAAIKGQGLLSSYTAALNKLNQIKEKETNDYKDLLEAEETAAIEVLMAMEQDAQIAQNDAGHAYSIRRPDDFANKYTSAADMLLAMGTSPQGVQLAGRILQRLANITEKDENDRVSKNAFGMLIRQLQIKAQNNPNSETEDRIGNILAAMADTSDRFAGMGKSRSSEKQWSAFLDFLSKPLDTEPEYTRDVAKQELLRKTGIKDLHAMEQRTMTVIAGHRTSLNEEQQTFIIHQIARSSDEKQKKAFFENLTPTQIQRTFDQAVHTTTRNINQYTHNRTPENMQAAIRSLKTLELLQARYSDLTIEDVDQNTINNFKNTHHPIMLNETLQQIDTRRQEITPTTRLQNPEELMERLSNLPLDLVRGTSQADIQRLQERKRGLVEEIENHPLDIALQIQTALTSGNTAAVGKFLNALHHVDITTANDIISAVGSILSRSVNREALHTLQIMSEKPPALLTASERLLIHLKNSIERPTNEYLSTYTNAIAQLQLTEKITEAQKTITAYSDAQVLAMVDDAMQNRNPLAAVIFEEMQQTNNRSQLLEKITEVLDRTNPAQNLHRRFAEYLLGQLDTYNNSSPHVQKLTREEIEDQIESEKFREALRAVNPHQQYLAAASYTADPNALTQRLTSEFTTENRLREQSIKAVQELAHRRPESAAVLISDLHRINPAMSNTLLRHIQSSINTKLNTDELSNIALFYNRLQNLENTGQITYTIETGDEIESLSEPDAAGTTGFQRIQNTLTMLINEAERRMPASFPADPATGSQFGRQLLENDQRRLLQALFTRGGSLVGPNQREIQQLHDLLTKKESLTTNPLHKTFINDLITTDLPNLTPDQRKQIVTYLLNTPEHATILRQLGLYNTMRRIMLRLDIEISSTEDAKEAAQNQLFADFILDLDKDSLIKTLQENLQLRTRLETVLLSNAVPYAQRLAIADRLTKCHAALVADEDAAIKQYLTNTIAGLLITLISENHSAATPEQQSVQKELLQANGPLSRMIPITANPSPTALNLFALQVATGNATSIPNTIKTQLANEAHRLGQPAVANTIRNATDLTIGNMTAVIAAPGLDANLRPIFTQLQIRQQMTELAQQVLEIGTTITPADWATAPHQRILTQALDLFQPGHSVGDATLNPDQIALFRSQHPEAFQWLLAITDRTTRTLYAINHNPSADTLQNILSTFSVHPTTSESNAITLSLTNNDPQEAARQILTNAWIPIATSFLFNTDQALPMIITLSQQPERFHRLVQNDIATNPGNKDYWKAILIHAQKALIAKQTETVTATDILNKFSNGTLPGGAVAPDIAPSIIQQLKNQGILQANGQFTSSARNNPGIINSIAIAGLNDNQIASLKTYLKTLAQLQSAPEAFDTLQSLLVKLNSDGETRTEDMAGIARKIRNQVVKTKITGPKSYTASLARLRDITLPVLDEIINSSNIPDAEKPALKQLIETALTATGSPQTQLAKAALAFAQLKQALESTAMSAKTQFFVDQLNDITNNLGSAIIYAHTTQMDPEHDTITQPLQEYLSILSADTRFTDTTHPDHDLLMQFLYEPFSRASTELTTGIDSKTLSQMAGFIQNRHPDQRHTWVNILFGKSALFNTKPYTDPADGRQYVYEPDNPNHIAQNPQLSTLAHGLLNGTIPDSWLPFMIQHTEDQHTFIESARTMKLADPNTIRTWALAFQNPIVVGDIYGNINDRNQFLSDMAQLYVQSTDPIQKRIIRNTVDRTDPQFLTQRGGSTPFDDQVENLQTYSAALTEAITDDHPDRLIAALINPQQTPAAKEALRKIAIEKNTAHLTRLLHYLLTDPALNPPNGNQQRYETLSALLQIPGGEILLQDTLKTNPHLTSQLFQTLNHPHDPTAHQPNPVTMKKLGEVPAFRDQILTQARTNPDNITNPHLMLIVQVNQPGYISDQLSKEDRALRNENSNRFNRIKQSLKLAIKTNQLSKMVNHLDMTNLAWLLRNAIRNINNETTPTINDFREILDAITPSKKLSQTLEIMLEEAPDDATFNAVILQSIAHPQFLQHHTREEVEQVMHDLIEILYSKDDPIRTKGLNAILAIRDNYSQTQSLENLSNIRQSVQAAIDKTFLSHPEWEIGNIRNLEQTHVYKDLSTFLRAVRRSKTVPTGPDASRHLNRMATTLNNQIRAGEDISQSAIEFNQFAQKHPDLFRQLLLQRKIQEIVSTLIPLSWRTGGQELLQHTQNALSTLPPDQVIDFINRAKDMARTLEPNTVFLEIITIIYNGQTPDDLKQYIQDPNQRIQEKNRIEEALRDGLLTDPITRSLARSWINSLSQATDANASLNRTGQTEAAAAALSAESLIGDWNTEDPNPLQIDETARMLQNDDKKAVEIMSGLENKLDRSYGPIYHLEKNIAKHMSTLHLADAPEAQEILERITQKLAARLIQNPPSIQENIHMVKQLLPYASPITRTALQKTLINANAAIATRIITDIAMSDLSDTDKQFLLAPYLESPQQAEFTTSVLNEKIKAPFKNKTLTENDIPEIKNLTLTLLNSIKTCESNGWLNRHTELQKELITTLNTVLSFTSPNNILQGQLNILHSDLLKQIRDILPKSAHSIFVDLYTQSDTTHQVIRNYIKTLANSDTNTDAIFALKFVEKMLNAQQKQVFRRQSTLLKEIAEEALQQDRRAGNNNKINQLIDTMKKHTPKLLYGSRDPYALVQRKQKGKAKPEGLDTSHINHHDQLFSWARRGEIKYPDGTPNTTLATHIRNKILQSEEYGQIQEEFLQDMDLQQVKDILLNPETPLKLRQGIIEKTPLYKNLLVSLYQESVQLQHKNSSSNGFFRYSESRQLTETETPQDLRDSNKLALLQESILLMYTQNPKLFKQITAENTGFNLALTHMNIREEDLQAAEEAIFQTIINTPAQHQGKALLALMQRHKPAVIIAATQAVSKLHPQYGQSFQQLTRALTTRQEELRKHGDRGITISDVLTEQINQRDIPLTPSDIATELMTATELLKFFNPNITTLSPTEIRAQLVGRDSLNGLERQLNSIHDNLFNRYNTPDYSEALGRRLFLLATNTETGRLHSLALNAIDLNTQHPLHAQLTALGMTAANAPQFQDELQFHLDLYIATNQSGPAWQQSMTALFRHHRTRLTNEFARGDQGPTLENKFKQRIKAELGFDLTNSVLTDTELDRLFTPAAVGAAGAPGAIPDQGRLVEIETALFTHLYDSTAAIGSPTNPAGVPAGTPEGRLREAQNQLANANLMPQNNPQEITARNRAIANARQTIARINTEVQQLRAERARIAQQLGYTIRLADTLHLPGTIDPGLRNHITTDPAVARKRGEIQRAFNTFDNPASSASGNFLQLLQTLNATFDTRTEAVHDTHSTRTFHDILNAVGGRLVDAENNTYQMDDISQLSNDRCQELMNQIDEYEANNITQLSHGPLMPAGRPLAQYTQDRIHDQAGGHDWGVNRTAAGFRPTQRLDALDQLRQLLKNQMVDREAQAEIDRVLNDLANEINAARQPVSGFDQHEEITNRRIHLAGAVDPATGIRNSGAGTVEGDFLAAINVNAIALQAAIARATAAGMPAPTVASLEDIARAQRTLDAGNNNERIRNGLHNIEQTVVILDEELTAQTVLGLLTNFFEPNAANRRLAFGQIHGNVTNSLEQVNYALDAINSLTNGTETGHAGHPGHIQPGTGLYADSGNGVGRIPNPEIQARIPHLAGHIATDLFPGNSLPYTDATGITNTRQARIEEMRQALQVQKAALEAAERARAVAAINAQLDALQARIMAPLPHFDFSIPGGSQPLQDKIADFQNERDAINNLLDNPNHILHQAVPSTDPADPVYQIRNRIQELGILLTEEFQTQQALWRAIQPNGTMEVDTSAGFGAPAYQLDPSIADQRDTIQNGLERIIQLQNALTAENVIGYQGSHRQNYLNNGSGRQLVTIEPNGDYRQTNGTVTANPPDGMMRGELQKIREAYEVALNRLNTLRTNLNIAIQALRDARLNQFNLDDVAALQQRAQDIARDHAAALGQAHNQDLQRELQTMTNNITNENAFQTHQITNTFKEVNFTTGFGATPYQLHNIADDNWLLANEDRIRSQLIQADQLIGNAEIATTPIGYIDRLNPAQGSSRQVEAQKIRDAYQVAVARIDQLRAAQQTTLDTAIDDLLNNLTMGRFGNELTGENKLTDARGQITALRHAHRDALEHRKDKSALLEKIEADVQNEQDFQDQLLGDLPILDNAQFHPQFGTYDMTEVRNAGDPADLNRIQRNLQLIVDITTRTIDRLRTTNNDPVGQAGFSVRYQNGSSRIPELDTLRNAAQLELAQVKKEIAIQQATQALNDLRAQFDQLKATSLGGYDHAGQTHLADRQTAIRTLSDTISAVDLTSIDTDHELNTTLTTLLQEVRSEFENGEIEQEYQHALIQELETLGITNPTGNFSDFRVPADISIPDAIAALGQLNELEENYSKNYVPYAGAATHKTEIEEVRNAILKTLENQVQAQRNQWLHINEAQFQNPTISSKILPASRFVTKSLKNTNLVELNAIKTFAEETEKALSTEENFRFELGKATNEMLVFNGWGQYEISKNIRLELGHHIASEQPLREPSQQTLQLLSDSEVAIGNVQIPKPNDPEVRYDNSTRSAEHAQILHTVQEEHHFQKKFVDIDNQVKDFIRLEKPDQQRAAINALKTELETLIENKNEEYIKSNGNPIHDSRANERIELFQVLLSRINESLEEPVNKNFLKLFDLRPNSKAESGYEFIGNKSVTDLVSIMKDLHREIESNQTSFYEARENANVKADEVRNAIAVVIQMYNPRTIALEVAKDAKELLNAVENGSIPTTEFKNAITNLEKQVSDNLDLESIPILVATEADPQDNFTFVLKTIFTKTIEAFQGHGANKVAQNKHRRMFFLRKGGTEDLFHGAVDRRKKEFPFPQKLATQKETEMKQYTYQNLELDANEQDKEKALKRLLAISDNLYDIASAIKSGVSLSKRIAKGFQDSKQKSGLKRDIKARPIQDIEATSSGSTSGNPSTPTRTDDPTKPTFTSPPKFSEDGFPNQELEDLFKSAYNEITDRFYDPSVEDGSRSPAPSTQRRDSTTTTPSRAGMSSPPPKQSQPKQRLDDGGVPYDPERVGGSGTRPDSPPQTPPPATRTAWDTPPGSPEGASRPPRATKATKASKAAKRTDTSGTTEASRRRQEMLRAEQERQQGNTGSSASNRSPRSGGNQSPPTTGTDQQALPVKKDPKNEPKP